MSSDIKVETRGRKPEKYTEQQLDIKPGRICLVNGVFGETGGGKSYQTIIEAKYYTQTIPGVKNGRKVLIFDTNGEYTMFPAIALNHIKDFSKVMVCRINARGWSDSQKKDGAIYCAKNFKNGLLIVDDIDKFAPFNSNKEFTSLMMGGRHEGDDLTLCHQSLDMGTTIFYRNALSIRLHNQVSNESALKSKCEKHLKILKIAQHIVNKQYKLGNERFFVTINLRKQKIHGCSNKLHFENACKAYLIANRSEVSDAIVDLVTYQKLKYNEAKTQKAWDMGFEKAMTDLDFFYATEPFHAKTA